MLRTIEKIRGKSEDHRRKVALASTSVIMLGIFFIWAVTFTYRFPELSKSQAQASAAEAIVNPDHSDTPSPLQSLKDGFSSSYANATQALNNANSSTNQAAAISNGVVITDVTQQNTDYTSLNSQNPDQLQVVQ